jgi:methylase of polypeptide subunit release factors
MILEIGYQQGEMVTQLIQELWSQANIVIRKDYAGLDRFVIVRL